MVEQGWGWAFYGHCFSCDKHYFPYTLPNPALIHVRSTYWNTKPTDFFFNSSPIERGINALLEGLN